MDDSLVFAKLTLMLLRASLPQADQVRRENAIVVLPDPTVLSEQDALIRIARLGFPLVCDAAMKERSLVVTARRATPDEEDWSLYTSTNFGEALHEINASAGLQALVEVEGGGESVLVARGIVERWLGQVSCESCPLSLSRPGANTPSEAIAVLTLGLKWRQARRGAAKDGEPDDDLGSFDRLLSNVLGGAGNDVRAFADHRSIEFLMSPGGSSKSPQEFWLITYGSGPLRTAFELQYSISSSADSQGHPTIYGVIKHHPEPESDYRPFLTALAGIHGVTQIATQVVPTDSLLFRGRVLGQAMDRQRSSPGLAGYFSTRPNGTWLVAVIAVRPTKLRASHLVMALSPATGEATLTALGNEQAHGVLSAFIGLLSR